MNKREIVRDFIVNPGDLGVGSSVRITELGPNGEQVSLYGVIVNKENGKFLVGNVDGTDREVLFDEAQVSPLV